MLMEKFERIVEAPNAVSQLREFMLSLAVRGKLVQQRPEDGTAGILLDRLHRASLNREKSASQDFRRLGTVAKPFFIPATWEWCALGRVGKIVGGGTPRTSDPGNFAPGGTAISWLTPADLGKDNKSEISHGARDLSPKGMSECSATLMPKGTVLFSSRAPIGYVAIAANPIATNQGFKSVVPYVDEMSAYIALYFRAFRHMIDAQASGTTFREVSGKTVAGLPFPLPPLAEQHRIVDRANELIALCDQLEDARSLREFRRNGLRVESLRRISDTNRSGVSAPGDVKLFLSESKRLITKPEHLADARRSILDLAVQGRLVSQSSDNKMTHRLVSRSGRQDGFQTVADGPNVISPATLPHAQPFQTPSGWVWNRLSDLCVSITDGDHQPPPQVPEGIPFLVIGNVLKTPMEMSNCRRVPPAYYSSLDSRRRPLQGDILYTLVGATLGRPVLVETSTPFCVQRHIGILRPSSAVSVEYLMYALKSRFAYNQAVACATGTGQKTVPLSGLRRLLIPVPSLAEQERIVGKVDELMAVCAELEVALIKVQTWRSELLEAALHEALNAGNGDASCGEGLG